VGRFAVFAPLPLARVTMLSSLEAAPEGGSLRGCPIALFVVSESRITGAQKTCLGAVGLDDLVLDI